MIRSDENSALLETYLAGIGVSANREQMFALLQHLDLVVAKNEMMNLTRIVDAHDAIVRHIVDSLLLLPSLEALEIPRNARFVDIGTGAGFPGIPLGIVTEYAGLLIDSVGKKVKAVQEFIEELGLSDRLEARSVRAEDLARDKSMRFDFVTARAVADLGVLIEYGTPLLKSHGYVVVSKARIADDELNRGDRTAQIVGLKRVSRETYELPDEMGHREILVYQQVGISRVKLPRQTGMAKHKPLAG